MNPLVALRFLSVIPAVLLAAPAPLAAQVVRAPQILLDAADSAARARTHFRTARASLTSADTIKALSELQSAANAFPKQPAYLTALFELALSSRNRDMVLDAIRMANAVGVALPVGDLQASRLNGGSGGVESLLAKQRSLAEPINASSIFRTISDKRLFPEGVAYDPRSGTTYVSSLSRRGVLAISREGAERMLTPELPNDIGGLYGVVVDTSRNVVWAASAQSPSTKHLNGPDTVLSALIAFDVTTGAIRHRYALRGSAIPPSPGDIALAQNGDLFVGDGQAGVIWWLKSGEHSVHMLQHKLYRSPQGMVASGDGRTLWIADYSHGLLKTDLATGATTRVADLAGISTVGIDGLVRIGQQFIGVQNATSPAHVLQFTLDESGDRMKSFKVLDRSAAAVSPTGGAIIGDDYVYIANSMWDLVKPDGSLPANAERAPVLLRIPLGAKKLPDQ